MGYTYSQVVTVNHSLCGASSSTDFPMLFGGSAGPYTALKTAANGGYIQNTVTFNGQVVPADLIFTSDSAGLDLLPFEIASHNASTGDIEVWIQIPTLSYSSNTVIYLFAGNAAVTTYQGGAVGAVWDANFMGVWHWANGTTLSCLDSTANAKNGTPSGSAAATAGEIDGALSIPTSSNVTAGAGQDIGGVNVTVECWVYPVSAAWGVFSNSNGAAYFNTRVLDGNVSPTIGITDNGNDEGTYSAFFGADSSGLFQGARSSSNVALNSAWVHLVGSWDGSEMSIYYNGALQGQNNFTLASGFGGYFNGNPWSFGYHAQWEVYALANMDEHRLSNVARSADWITATYNSQSSPATFYALTNNPLANTIRLLGLLGVGM